MEAIFIRCLIGLMVIVVLVVVLGIIGTLLEHRQKKQMIQQLRELNLRNQNYSAEQQMQQATKKVIDQMLDEARRQSEL